MKCKDCNWCEQRGSYGIFFCAKDNARIQPEDYYKGKNMDCTESDRELEHDVMCYSIFNRMRNR
jgi:hypothetical protein